MWPNPLTPFCVMQGLGGWLGMPELMDRFQSWLTYGECSPDPTTLSYLLGLARSRGPIFLLLARFPLQCGGTRRTGRAGGAAQQGGWQLRSVHVCCLHGSWWRMASG